MTMRSDRDGGFSLLSVTPCGADAYTLRLRGREGAVSHTVLRQDYEEIGEPAAGDALTEERVAEIQDCHRRYLAIERALRILEAGENSRRQLRQKLVLRGVDREHAAFAVEYLFTRGYLKEREQAYRLAVSDSRYKLWGREKILLHLLSRGYAREDILLAIDAAEEDGEIDLSATFERLAEKKLGENPTKQDLAALRYKYGYK